MLAALSRVVEAHEIGGGAFIVVDAAGEKAQRLYAHHRFVPITDTKDRTTRMVLPVSTAKELFREP
jgi:hypothetical protein